MAELDLEKIRRIKKQTEDDTSTSDLWELVKLAGRGVERGMGLSGVGLAEAFQETPAGRVGKYIPGYKDWIPEAGRLPEAREAFIRFAREGDIDAAINAYWDEANAGKYFRGTAELGGAVIPTGGPALLGGQLLSKAPQIASGISRHAPQAMRPGLHKGLSKTISGVGQAARLPWLAEELPFRLLGKFGKFGKGLYRRFRPEAEAEEAIRMLGAGDAPMPQALPSPATPQPLRAGATQQALPSPSIAGYRAQLRQDVQAAHDEQIAAGLIDPRPQKVIEDEARGRRREVAAVLQKRREDIRLSKLEQEHKIAADNVKELEARYPEYPTMGQYKEIAAARKAEESAWKAIKDQRANIVMIGAKNKGWMAKLEMDKYRQRLDAEDPARYVPIADRRRRGYSDLIQEGEEAFRRQPKTSVDDIIPEKDAVDFIKESDPSGPSVFKGDPSGAPPPKQPVGAAAKGFGEVGATPEDADDVFGLIERVALEGETIPETIFRRHEGAVTAAEKEATRTARGGWNSELKRYTGEAQLHALGLTKTVDGREIIKDQKSLAIVTNLYRALHSKDPGARNTVPANLRGVYDELRALADWEQTFRLDFDPWLVKSEGPYFFRGWKMGKWLKGQFQTVQGRLGSIPAFAKKRNLATFDEMLEAGFEPLSWNPYEQWRISSLQGIRYRQQSMLISTLKNKELVKGLSDEDIAGVIPIGWRVPQVGPAFQGKAVDIIDPKTGERVSIIKGQMIVPDDVAKRLEAMYGVPFDKLTLPKLQIKGRVVVPEVDVLKVIDAIVFIPKRIKLMVSFFQQTDFLSRSWAGTWSRSVDLLVSEKRPVAAVKHLATWPRSAYKMLEANLSPGYREELKKQLGSKTPLVQGRPGVHLKGMVEAGLSVRDVSIFPGIDEMNAIAGQAAEDVGKSGVRSVLRAIGQIESAMRRGLFDGVYPAAQITDIKNNAVHMFIRKFPNATDEQINGYVAKYINTKYSTIPVSQSVFQKRWIRGLLQRLFFSIGESEGLLRQATGAVRGPNKAIWQKHWVGAYLSLMATANTIHFASTADYKKLSRGDIAGGKGDMLPLERWVPLSKDHWGALNPLGYRREFAAPTLPFKGRSETEVTLDTAGQMDTALRVLHPLAFVESRLSVPAGALRAQIRGRDFFGAPIDHVGPDGFYSRMAAGMVDMFAPIGIGQAAIDIAREQIPFVGELLPPGEETIGTGGQLLQATGLNIRGETTPQLKDRTARESGMTIQFDPDESRIGQPVEKWEDLTKEQERELLRESQFSEELILRQELSARRGKEFAQQGVERRQYEDQFIGQAEKTAGEHLMTGYDPSDPSSIQTAVVDVYSADYNPAQAKAEVQEYRSDFYKALFGLLFDPELKKHTGGVYDTEEEMEEPEEGTDDHLRWQYREVFENSRDEEGNINYDIFDKLEAKMWAGLSGDEADRLLRDIRGTERQLHPEIQVILNAARYAGSFETEIDGQTVNYWDIEDLPIVRNWIIKTSGGTAKQVEEYIKATANARVYMHNDEAFARIGDALKKAQFRDGVLGMRRVAFMRQTQQALINEGKTGYEWYLAMWAGGNRFLLQEQVREVLKNDNVWGAVNKLDYEGLHRQVVRRKAGPK